MKMNDETSPINNDTTIQIMKVEEYLEHVKTRKSINLYRLNRRGLELFFQWIQKDANEVIEDAQKRAQMESFKDRNYYGFKIEEFYKWLTTAQTDRPAFGHNTGRVYCGAVKSFFAFYNIVNLEVSGDITQVTGDQYCYVPKIPEFQKMFAVGDLRAKVVVSLGLDLGWRPEDFLEVKKNEIDLNATEPQPIGRITQKEKEEAHSFISMETLELLKLYIPQLKADNPYLFPNGNHGHITEEALNNILKKLVEKAQIQTGKKVFTFKAFRKRLLSQAVDIQIDPNAAKLITGKAVAPEMRTYIESADFKAQFIKLRTSMRLSEKAEANHTKLEELAKEVKQLRQMVYDKDLELEVLKETLRTKDPDFDRKYKMVRERKLAERTKQT
jgi:integrase